MSFTSTAPTPAASSTALTSTAPTPATLVAAPAALAEDAFAGGTFRQRTSDGTVVTYESSASTAEDEDGEITLTLAEDLDPEADEGDTYEVIDADGERWACDLVTPPDGDPWACTIGNLRKLPGRRF